VEEVKQARPRFPQDIDGGLVHTVLPRTAGLIRTVLFKDIWYVLGTESFLLNGDIWLGSFGTCPRVWGTPNRVRQRNGAFPFLGTSISVSGPEENMPEPDTEWNRGGRKQMIAANSRTWNRSRRKMC